MKKKLIAAASAAIMLLSAATGAVPAQMNGLFGGAPSAYADTLTSGNYEYEVLGDGTVEVTGYTGSETAMVIPSEIDGKSVTKIGDNAFSWNSFSFTMVTIPSGVTSIGERAFYYNDNLTDVTIPESVKTIGDSAFGGCAHLTGIVIPSGVKEIDAYAFDACTDLTSIDVDSANTEYTSIDGVLYDKDVTTLLRCPAAAHSVSIPLSVTKIGTGAFDSCTEMTSISLSSQITLIGNRAFSFCISLTELKIPTSVTYIGEGAFYGAGLTSIVIPDSVSGIGDGMFENCSDLVFASLPSGITSIGFAQFSGCAHLTGLVIPQGVTSIDQNAFFDCSSLTRINIPNSVTSIDEDAFANCTSLTEVTIPAGVTSIGSEAFGYYDVDDICMVAARSSYGPSFPKVPGFTINCYYGTAGEQYALDNGFDYYLIQKPIIGFTASQPKDATYTGAAIKPTVTLKNGTTTLKLGTDYTVIYKNNTAVGKATLTITGKGNYTGTITKTFKINPKAATLSSVTAGAKKATVKFTKVSGVSGYVIYRATAKTGTYTKIKTTTATSYTNTGLTKGKTYYYKVRSYKTVGGVQYYSSYSSVKSAKAK
ncbi:MAG: leucine-rich repeat domain-containing protein [Oscillospiraceae bacterium]